MADNSRELAEIHRQLHLLRGDLNGLNYLFSVVASCTFNSEQKNLFVKLMGEVKNSLGDGVLDNDGIPTKKATAFEKGLIEILNNATAIVEGNPGGAHWRF